MDSTADSDDPRRLSRLRELFLEAVALPEPEWADFVARQCPDDPELRGRLLGLLRVDRALGDVEAEEAPAEPLPEAFGPYRVEAVLGSGGMGTVYRARQSEPIRRDVAIKVVRAGVEGRDVLSRFELERRALAAMNHRSIARIIDAGVGEDGAPYFVMEFVDGPTVTDYCDGQGLGVRERVELFRQVCLGVQHAHSRGVVHRDLKPGNVLVAEENSEAVAKILDFGLAKIVHSEFVDPTAVTQASLIMGTPEYMSPEQAAGRGALVDPRSDIYSLGVLLYELLAGVRPYDSRDLAEPSWCAVQRMICETEPPKPSARLVGETRARSGGRHGASRWSERRRAIRGDLDWITMRAIEKQPDRRYGSAAELALDLGRFLNHEPVTAGPPTSSYRLRKFLRKYRGRVAALTAVIVALTVAAAVAWVSLGRTERARVEAVQQRERAETQAARAVAVRDLITRMLAAPDPYEARSRDYTVRELLEDFVAGIDGRFAEQPLVEAELRWTISQAYEGLGLYEASRGQARRSETLARRAGDASALARAETASGTAEFQLGDLAAAERLFRAALDRLSQVPDRPLERAATLFALGRLLDWKGEYQRPGDREEARARLEQALELERAHRDANDPELTSTLRALSRVLAVAGEHERAITLAEEAVELRRAQRGEAHVSHATNLYNLSIVLRHAERLEDAESYAREALGIWRRELEAGHPNVASGLIALGRVLELRDSLPDAVAAYGEARELWRKIDPDHPRIARCCHLLGLLAWRMGDAAVAVREFTAELALRRQRLPEEHPSVRFARQNLAFALRDAGRLEDAVAQFETLLRTSGSGEPKPLTVALLQEGCGEALRRQGRFEAAVALLDSCLDIRTRELGMGELGVGELGMGEVRTAHARTLLGAALSGAGASATGGRLLEEAYEQLERAQRPRWAAETARLLGEHFRRLQRHDEARTWTQRSRSGR